MPLFRRKPKGVPFDRTIGDPRAAHLVRALGADDLDGVRTVLGEASSPEEREWLLSLVSDVPDHYELFGRWVDAESDSQLAWLARGAYGVGHAWAARGRDVAERVGEDAFEVFWERLRVAEDDLLRAAEMDAGDPVPWSNLLVSGRGLQVPKEELWMRYDEAQNRRPWLVEANAQLLQSLCKKWFGSDEEALEFARRVDREAPDGAAARAVLPMAHIEIWLAKHDRDGENPAAYREDATARDEIRAAAERSVLADGFADESPNVFAMNVFAMGLYLFGSEPAAQELAARLGTRRTEFPWIYFNDGDRVYGELLGD